MGKSEIILVRVKILHNWGVRGDDRHGIGIDWNSVSNGIDDDMLVPLIGRAGLGDFFHHWTSSESAQSCKPDRRFFEHALELSGYAPADVLFVGDSPEHDIVGAAALGMQTALIVDGGMEPPLQTGRGTATPDHVIHNLAELKAVLGG